MATAAMERGRVGRPAGRGNMFGGTAEGRGDQRSDVMTDERRVNRRTVLQGAGVAALSAVLAGCTGGSGGPSGDGGGGDGGSSDGGGDGSSDGGSGGSKPGFGGWLSDVSNYDGVVDRTGKSEVTVTVGTEGNQGNNGFGPAAVTVSTGTTVVWEWTGKGSSHNVVEKGGAFESDYHSEEGATFEHTFESAGTTKYYCAPHKAMGMKGVVVVE